MIFALQSYAVHRVLIYAFLLLTANGVALLLAIAIRIHCNVVRTALPLYTAVLPDGLDQLLPKKLLITVILPTACIVEVCIRALNVSNTIAN